MGGNRNRALLEVALDAVNKCEIIVLCETTPPAPNIIYPSVKGKCQGKGKREEGRGEEGRGGKYFSLSPIGMLSDREIFFSESPGGIISDR